MRATPAHDSRRYAAFLALATLLLVSIGLTFEPAGAARDKQKARGNGAVGKAIPRLEPEARRKWSDSFAGLWIGEGGGSTKKQRAFGLRPASLSLRAGERRTVPLAFDDDEAVAKLRRLLKRKAYRRGSTARIAVRATDAAGNSTARELEVKLDRSSAAGSSRTSQALSRAAIQLGELAPGDPEDCGAARNNVQAATGPGPSYEVPADGVITRWRHNGNPPDGGSGRLQVWRRSGGTSYTLVGRSALETLGPGANSFATSIPVREGDLLGLRGDAVAGCTFGAAAGDVVRFDGFGATDPAPGATRNMSSDDPELRVNVAATLEPDDTLALDVDAAERQRVDELQLSLSCPEEACEAQISGAAVARRQMAGKRVFVAFTDNAKKRVGALRRGFPKPGMLRPVSVDHSLRELEGLQQRMIADRESFRETGPPFPGVPHELYDLDIDVTRNAPVVILEHPTDAAAAAFRDRYGPFVIVEHGTPAEPDVLYPCSSREVCYKLRSGLRAETKTGSGCSTAFMAFLGRSTKTRGILSAAHCGGPNPDNPNSDLGAPRFHGGVNPLQYGTVQREEYFGRVDAEWHYVSREPFTSLKPAPWIYRNDSHRDDHVERVGKPDQLVIGSAVCKSGVTTDYSCGEVTSKSYSPNYITWSSDFVRAEYCSQPGDSGAGVYVPIPSLKPPPGKPGRYTAVGIHSGAAKDTPCSSPSHFALFGHLKYAEDELGVKVPLAASP
jgi:hypothetical protein